MKIMADEKKPRSLKALPGRLGKPKKAPVEIEGESKGKMLGDSEWGRALIEYLKEAQDVNGHSIQRVAKDAEIPFATLHEHMAGGGRLLVHNFLLIAKYVRVPAPELLRIILPAEQKRRSALRSQLAAEPLAEQLAIAQEVLMRIGTDLIDRRREHDDD